MSNDLNISLKSQGEPNVNIKLGDEARNIVESDSASSPIISFVATGLPGIQGVPGTAQIGSDSVTSAEIADGTITSAQIQNYTISTQDIGAYQITEAKLQTDAVTTPKIKDGAVTSSKIKDNSILAQHIVDGTVVKELINDLELPGTKLENNSITTAKVANGAITSAKIADKTISGGQLADNLILTGLTKLKKLIIEGESPGYIDGPDNDLFYIRSGQDLIFVIDHDQASYANTSYFKFQNVSGSDLVTISETGQSVFNGNLTVNGDISVTGTVDGLDINAALGLTQASLNKVQYITVTQPVDLDAMEAKLDGITDNEAIDWTVDQGSTNIHAGNYTDTNTQLSTEEVQDIVGAMFTSNTETRVAATYDDSDGTIDLVVDDMTADTNTQLTDEQVQDIVGAMVDGGTETNISVTYDDTSGKLNFVSTDTNTTYSSMGSGNSYAAGLTPAGSASHGAEFLRKDGTWVVPPDTNTTYVEATSSYMGLMSIAHHDKLDGIATGAEVNVQSDWNSSSGDSQILNKPTIPVDLTTDGAGTIHANNVGTLNQDTTGNAATATTLTNGNKSLSGIYTTKGYNQQDNRNLTVGADGHAIHVDASDMTDASTSASGTNATYNHVTFENCRLMATNSSVTTTNASTVYIKGAPAASTNQTITNAYALYVAGGASYFAGAVQLDSIELGDASDTTIHRTHAGRVAIEGNEIQTTNKHRHFINFGVNLAYNYARYIPIGSYYIYEQNTDSNPEYTTYVAPHDGKFIKALVRSEESLANTTLTIYKVGDGTEEPDQGSTVDTKTVDIASANTSYTYTFDGDATFSAGDALAIKIQPTTDPTAAGVVGTFCLEFDLTT